MKVLAEKIGNYDINGPTQTSNAKKNPTSYGNYLMNKVDVVATLEFSPERKAMSTVISGYDGKKNNCVLLKGAPERVIEKCSKVLTQSGQEVDLNRAGKDKLTQRILGVAKQGFRVLGIAIGRDGGNMKEITAANASEKLADTSKYAHYESNLAFLGYVCIRDPVRPEVKQAIVECKTAGINVIMITGDSKETAIAVAKELRIIEADADTSKCCFTGAEFEDLSAKQR